MIAFNLQLRKHIAIKLLYRLLCCNYLDVSTTQLIYGNYFIGKNRNQLVLTADASNFLATNRNRYPSETVRSAQAQLEWNAGIGTSIQPTGSSSG